MNKNYSLGLYEKAMPAQLTLEKTGNSGFDWLEMSMDESDRKLSRLDWGREQILLLRRSIESSEVPIRTMRLSAHRKYSMGSLIIYRTFMIKQKKFFLLR